VFHPNFPVMDLSNATIESKWFFQFVFCAVSLAIVWARRSSASSSAST
jgi:hypothetical protein